MASAFPTPLDCCTGADCGCAAVNLTSLDATIIALIAQYGSTGVVVARTLAEMQAIPSATTNRYCVLQGLLAAGDGGVGTYYWDAAGTDAENVPLIVRPSDFTTAGLWRKLT